MIGGELHIDGGTFNNFPTDVMQRAGASRIIGVNLLRERGQTYELDEVPGSLELMRDKLRGKRKKFKLPSLSSLLLNTSLMASYARHQQSLALVDLQFAPVVYRFGMLDWSKFDQIIEVGYAHAMEQLEQLGEEGIAASAETSPLAASWPVPSMEGLDSLELPTRQQEATTMLKQIRERYRARYRTLYERDLADGEIEILTFTVRVATTGSASGLLQCNESRASPHSTTTRALFDPDRNFLVAGLLCRPCLCNTLPDHSRLSQSGPGILPERRRHLPFTWNLSAETGKLYGPFCSGLQLRWASIFQRMLCP